MIGQLRRKTLFYAAVLLASLLGAQVVQAQEFPAKPVTLVIPFGAGGSHDLTARAVTSVAIDYLNQPMLVQLKPGGGGAIASEFVAKAAPDGYTLLEEMRFPFGAIRSIRGFVFLDAGAAWLRNDAWYDPETFRIRADIDALGRTTLIPFEFWDGEGNRLQDLRASWGFGFQFFFLGGLQLNWSWAKRLPYTQYVDVDPNPFIVDLEKAEAPNDGWRSDFYIVFDF